MATSKKTPATKETPTKKPSTKKTPVTKKAPTSKKTAARKPSTSKKKTSTTKKPPATKKASTLKIEYYRSAIGLDKKQKSIVKGLGFRRLNAVREFEDSPGVRGMVAKIPHLVRIVGE